MKPKYIVKMILKVFNITKTIYYRWKQKKNEVNPELEEIKAICHKHKFTYGYRNMTAEFNKFSEKKSIIKSTKTYAMICSLQSRHLKSKNFEGSYFVSQKHKVD